MAGSLLVVDDEGPLLRAMQRLFVKSYSVKIASGVMEALSRFTDDVQVVLTDFSMPDGNGLQLARELRSRGFKGIIVVLSAVVETDELQRALDRGEISALFSKPWKPPDLLAFVAGLFEKISSNGK